MNPTVAEWVKKAEGDFVSAGRELRARNKPNYDSACFHSQQCAEKYLKAMLQANDKRIPKIHFLLELLGMILKFDGACELLRTDLNVLEDYAVRFRYPGDSAEKEEARSAYQSAKVVRQFVRQKLGLK